MDQFVSIRIPRRWLKAAAVLAVLATVLTPVAAAASHQFTDVPNSNVFHSDISWLSNSGVTAGCNPPTNDRFCPSDNVTREQMAAFMKRLATGQKVDAGKVQGYSAADLAPRASFDSRGSSAWGQGLNGSLATVTITAPASGILLIDSTVSFRRFASGTDNLACWLYLDGTEIDGNGVSLTVDGDGSDAIGCAPTAATVVTAGTYTVTAEVASVDAATYVYDRTLWAMWVPFDGTGNTP